MHILMFSINPLFPHTVMGGAPKHLQNIALYMGEHGHTVTVLCTQTTGSDTPFYWHPNVQIKPILRFKQPFPQPYAIPAYDLADIVQIVGEHLAHADRFYMHDGEFLFPFAYAHIPTVVSLRDNVYPETIHGGFLFQGDKLILISEYSRQYYLQTVGRFFPELTDRIEVVPNGLDWERFKPTPPSRELLDLLQIDPSQHPIVLHPHRPEPTKGIPQTLAAADLLVHRHGVNNLKVLIPRWHDVQHSADLQTFYDNIQAEIAARGLNDHIVFHSWIPQRLMPEYYSLGAVTFSLGSFPESFGNAVYESLGCGTLSIAARIATHRELVPDELMLKVDFDDAEAAAALAYEVIHNKRRTSPETLAYIHKNYSTTRQLQQYAEVIENARVVPPMRYQLQTITETTRFKLTAWCYLNAQGKLYHDFKANYVQGGGLVDLLEASPEGITIAQAQQHGLDLMQWYRDGYLYPL